MENKTKETLDRVLKKFNKWGVECDENSDKVIVNMGRYKDFPRMLSELGFKTGLELGVFSGTYTRYLLKHMPGVKLYGVDAWTLYGDYSDFSAERIVKAEQEAHEAIKGFDCTLIKGFSADVAPQFEDGSLDFVFIDGNHDYQHCVQDLDLWARKVRKGGIVAGHDYDDYSNKSRWWSMHVMDAVDGWCRSYRIKPLFIMTKNPNNSWFYVK